MSKEVFSIKDRIFVITGGMGKLGQSFTNEILTLGSKVAILDILDYENNLVLDLIDKENLLYFKTDITKKSQIQSAVKKIINRWGTINILINNASLDSPPDAPSGEVGPFETYPETSFDKVMDVNVKGTYLCCQVIGNIMAKQGKGSIINISSIYGLLSPNQNIYDFRRKKGEVYYKPVAYSISKSAIFNLTRYLATYWAKRGVRINTLTLGGIFNDQPEEFLNSYCKNVPLGRMAKAEEAVGPMIFLASDASSYMTGANLLIDGGWTAW